jgi:MGT family glycosyltransferase
MGRFLIVVPPLVGHTNPTVPLGRELERQGHAVAWCGYRTSVGYSLPALLPDGATVFPAPEALPDDMVAGVEQSLARPRSGVAGFKQLWDEHLVPAAHQMLPGVQAAVADWAPDVVVADQSAIAGVAVAEAHGLPWATSATTSADLVDVLEAMPKLQEWLRGRMAEVLVAAGIDPERAATVDTRFSPHLVLAFTVEELVGRPDGTGFPGHYAFVGPSLGERRDDTPFPWDWLAEGLDGEVDGDVPTVLVTLGTVNWRAGARFFAVAAETLRDMPVRAVMVAPPDLLPDPPPNVLVAERVPQLALLRHVAAVVCHGGHNTVCESLAHGVPLVVAAVRDDQPLVADQVVRAGAGVRVRFARITVPMLREALDAVLTDPTYRTAAARVQIAFAQAGGPVQAANRLIQILNQRVQRVRT